MSATSTRPQCSRPGSSRWPGLRRKNVTVSRGADRHAHHRAAGAVDAARQIDGDRPARPHAFIASIIARAGAFDRPVEPGAEQRIDDDVRHRRSAAGVAASTGPVQRCRGLAASPLSWSRVAEQQHAAPDSRARPGCARRQSRRRRCCRGRRPPRPTARRADRSAPRRRRPRGRRSPSARCPACPPAIARRSASAISAVVSSSIMARSTLLGGGRIRTTRGALDHAVSADLPNRICSGISTVPRPQCQQSSANHRKTQEISGHFRPWHGPC